MGKYATPAFGTVDGTMALICMAGRRLALPSCDPS
jgi:hypothetical protein